MINYRNSYNKFKIAVIPLIILEVENDCLTKQIKK